MSETALNQSTPVRGSFPQARRKRRPRGGPKCIEYHQHSVDALTRLLPHLVAICCGEIPDAGWGKVTPEMLFGRSRSQRAMRKRRWIWWMLRHHPAAGCSLPVIAEAFCRDHATIRYTLGRLHWRLAAGLENRQRDILQTIADELAARGFPAFNVRDAL